MEELITDLFLGGLLGFRYYSIILYSFCQVLKIHHIRIELNMVDRREGRVFFIEQGGFKYMGFSPLLLKTTPPLELPSRTNFILT